MTLGSLFDGIGGWLLAARHAGVEPLWSSEIEAFPCAVTKHHFPDVVQLGDITKLDGTRLWPVDIICAGSPCQNLSIAGNRKGLQGEQSGLFMHAIRLVRDMRRASGGKYPRFFVWENVPGAFSSNKGNDFRAVLEEIGETKIPLPQLGRWTSAGMVDLSKCQIAWRTLDAKYFGIAQRRKRLFIVADFGGRSAGEILFERESVRGDSSTGRKEKLERDLPRTERSVGTASVMRWRSGCAGGGKGALVSNEKSLTLATANDQVLFVPDKARSLTARADGSPCIDRGPQIISVYQNSGYGKYTKGNICQTLQAAGGDCGGGSETLVCKKTVRRLTPTECERLQGLPDGYTLIDDKACSDTARYKALGNGMAQPCADYVIKRIVEVTA